MPDWDLPRSPASALLLVQLGREYDVDPERSLRGARLTLAQLHDPATEVTADQEMRIVGNLLAAVPDDVALGVDAGMRYHLTTHGIWGFALASSSTLRSAIAIGVRYVDLTFALCRIYRDDTDTPARLMFDGSRVPSEVRRFFVERELASVVHLARQLLSEPDARFRVHFSHTAPPSTTPYEAAFGALPEFDATASYVELDDAVLDRPLPQADAHAAALAEKQCRELAR
ncbi:AraC family transcriptional regulator, partial [Haloechinothrix halophila]|uniref:AraC family transcriptional regulator n=1 Tax=Haloechinothrix halophila TaxID=1069073 RepID=UPI00040C2CCC